MDEDSQQRWVAKLVKAKQEAEVVEAKQESAKSWVLAILLSFLLGYFGMDRFYLGYTWSGVLKLITFGGLGIWYILDLVLLMIGALPDAYGGQLRAPFRD